MAERSRRQRAHRASVTIGLLAARWAASSACVSSIAARRFRGPGTPEEADRGRGGGGRRRVVCGRSGRSSHADAPAELPRHRRAATRRLRAGEQEPGRSSRVLSRPLASSPAVLPQSSRSPAVPSRVLPQPLSVLPRSGCSPWPLRPPPATVTPRPPSSFRSPPAPSRVLPRSANTLRSPPRFRCQRRRNGRPPPRPPAPSQTG